MTQHTPLVPEDWIAKGYKQFKSTIKPLADFGLQKRFDDENGKRYFITVWVYDNSAYMDSYEGLSMWSFSLMYNSQWKMVQPLMLYIITQTILNGV